MSEDRNFNNMPAFRDLGVGENEISEAVGAALEKFEEYGLDVEVIAIELSNSTRTSTLAKGAESRRGCPPGYIMINGRCVRKPR